MKLRIYQEADAGPNANPVATVTIGTSPDGDLSPAHVEPSARFFLEAIDTTDEDVRERLKTALARETVPVSRALVSTRGAVRTRGDTTAPEPYGTPAYWRAALGRLPFTERLSCDPDDYKKLLAWVDPPAAPVAPVAAGVEAPPKPSFELSPALREQLIALIKPFLQPRLQFEAVRVRGALRSGEAGRTVQELLELLRGELASNPDFLLATANLRLALSLPEEDREKILKELEDFARRAKSRGSQSD
jgi:hypothetical protein